MFWWILLAILAILLLGFLFAPLKLHLDSANNNYFISYGWIVKVSARFLHDDIAIRFNLFGAGKNTSLLEIAAKRKRKKSIPEKVADSVVKTTKRRVPLKVISAFIRTFKVKRFYVDIDFGSVYFNAWLYPLGEIIKLQNVRFTTNFSGKSTIAIEIVNRPAHMIWAIIKTQLKTKVS